jgi:hypothetical protein
MDARYVLGADPVPVMAFSARVGGPLSTARAEVASLLQLLLDLLQHYSHQTRLLVFVDCLVVLDILQKSLALFACVCPKFREARTSAHNQVQNVFTSFLNSALESKWTVFEETQMARTGLVLQSTSSATADELGLRQPDWVLVSESRKRIAIVDLCQPSDTSTAQLQLQP